MPLCAKMALMPFSNISAKAIVLSLSLCLAQGYAGFLPGHASSISDLPAESMRTPPMVKENSISTYVPSESAEGNGLAVNLLYGSKPRYVAGAPVAVVVPGGTGADGLTFNMHAAQQGFVEVRFAFPGGGSPQFMSKGSFDNRGKASVEALRDVILFAGGKKPDYKGRFIADLLADQYKVDPQNIGVVGWDNGGNQALVALAKYVGELEFVNWLAFYESPVGSMFSPPNLGSATDLVTNKYYREGSAATGNILVDYRKLKWNANAFRNPNRITGKKRGTPGLKGVLYFDDNGNGQWEEAREFAFNSSLDTNALKQYFPPQVAAAAERLNVFGGFWPGNVASVSESEEFFADRDGSLYIAQICRDYPKLLVGVFGSAVDHNQQQIDHPHITFLYNAFLTNKVRWLKLNPDNKYMAHIAQMNAANFVNNRPSTSIDSGTEAGGLLTHLEPEGIVPDYVYMQALICEMADRLKTKKLKENLAAPILNYSSGAVEHIPPKPIAAPAKGAEKPSAAQQTKPATTAPVKGKKGNK